MPEITGTLSADGSTYGPCVWCGEPSDALGITPGRPDLGSVPIHVFCSGAVLVAYRKLREGSLIGRAYEQLEAFEGRLSLIKEGNARLVRSIEDGRPAAELRGAFVSFAGATEAEIRYALDFLDYTVPTWRDQVRAATYAPGGFVGPMRPPLVGESGPEDVRREIESRNRAFAGEPFAVRDPDAE